MRLIDVDALGVGRCSRDLLPADYCAGWNGLVRLLGKAPTVDAVPVVHGRKIEDGDIGCFWLCSLCGECLPYGANYCPNCGAKMDGGGNNG